MTTTMREITYELSRFITASLPEVWTLHTDAAAWPTWNGDVLAVTLNGPMAARSTLNATTSEGSWRTRIYAVTHEELTFWGDVVDDGSRWLQSWTFDEAVRGVRVTATTSVLGSDTVSGTTLARHLRGTVERWLDCLQQCAELNTARGT